MPSGIYERTKEHNRKVSEAKKGIPRPDWVRKKISLSNKGKKAWNKGIPINKKTREKLRQIRLNNPTNGQYKKGHGCSKEIREKISLARKGQHAREKHPGWKGGITDERICMCYRREWIDMKGFIRKRDKYICQKCNIPENGNKFHMHHMISFEVKELRLHPDNLIFLCPQCHSWIHSKNNIEREFLEIISSQGA